MFSAELDVITQDVGVLAEIRAGLLCEEYTVSRAWGSNESNARNSQANPLMTGCLWLGKINADYRSNDKIRYQDLQISQ